VRGFLQSDAMHKRRPMPSCGVCPSVLLTRSGIVAKPVIVPSYFFNRRIATPFWCFHTKRCDNIPCGDTHNVGKNRNFRPTSGFGILLEFRMSSTISTVVQFIALSSGIYLSRRPSRRSATHQGILFMTASLDGYAEVNRTEFNCT